MSYFAKSKEQLAFPDQEKQFEGVLYLKKPKFFSSYDVVEVIKKYLNLRKVGHAGTLDPQATGLLIVLIGKSTSFFEYFINQEKEYLATIVLGISTLSDDADSEVVEVNRNFKVSKKELEKIFCDLKGEIWQKPPVYSALKIRGKRMYQLARKGVLKEADLRKVKIKKIKLISLKKRKNFYLLKCKIVCGRGFYVRSFARELGEILKCGAYLHDLQRTRIGDISINKAITLGDFIKLAKCGEVHRAINKVKK